MILRPTLLLLISIALTLLLAACDGDLSETDVTAADVTLKLTYSAFNEDMPPIIAPKLIKRPAPAAPAPAEVEKEVKIVEVERAPEAAPAPAKSVSIPSGGVFRKLSSDPLTLDPHMIDDTISKAIVVEIFSGLVALNTDLQLEPDIAERWEISPDYMSYIFHLRKDARFHDGKYISAQDFKWSIERAVDPKTGSPTAAAYLNDIVGVGDMLEGRATDIRGIEIVDDYTLRIYLDAPRTYFLTKLTHPIAYVLDRANVEGGGERWTDSPNGSGPFKLKEYRKGERIVLERNEQYYREPAFLDSVVMNLAGGQSMAMYENDEIDITVVGSTDRDELLYTSGPLREELLEPTPSFSMRYIGFNTAMPPFDDANIRRALTHAVDKDLIGEVAFLGKAEPAYSILPPGFPGYTGDVEGLRYDPARAKELLDKSACAANENLLRNIVVTIPGTGGGIGIYLEIVLDMWKEIGVDVTIQQVDWEESSIALLQRTSRSLLKIFVENVDTRGYILYPRFDD